jgi:predicted metal-dependent hydrolase
MSNKTVELPGIGEVVLAKRRGTKSLRITIQPNGRVRIGMPIWAPYSAGISFALSRRDWILKNQKSHQPQLLQDGHQIGKSYRLHFSSKQMSKPVSARLGINTITISTRLDPFDVGVQAKVVEACEKALKNEAKKLLKIRLDYLSHKHGLAYKELKVKKLSARWGSCSSNQVITLNYYLIQLPWELIDYVIMHELVHTRHLNHSRSFWDLMDQIIPSNKQLRRDIKRFRPVLMPS